MYALNPVIRRIVYVLIFEILAIISSTYLLMLLSGSDAQGSLPIAIAISVVAVVWNYTYNLLFEQWEARRKATSRSLLVRVCHAFGFEFGLCVIIIPLYMVWYKVGFMIALQMEIALLIFFLIFTFVFTYIFDSIFALPHHQANNQ